MRMVRICGLLIVVFILAGCGDLSFTPNLTETDDPALIPTQPDPEAFAIALWLSNEITAPSDLYERVQSDLVMIREEYSDNIPAVDLKFQEPWELGRLILGFEPEQYQQISDGQYHEWDSLNTLFNMESVDLSMPAFKMLKLNFENPLNPEILAEAYQHLPGLRFVVPNRYMGERSMLLPATSDDGRLLYFFRNAWGDCPSGCLYAEFWVLTVINDRIVYDGYFSDKTMMPDDLLVAFETAWTRYWQGIEASPQFAPSTYFAHN